jgi:hypothetical protein
VTVALQAPTNGAKANSIKNTRAKADEAKKYN